MHYLLFYDVVTDYAERRAKYRAEHLAYARAAHARGELLLGGALADPLDGAVLLFRGDSPAVAERFAAADPYVTNGLPRSFFGRGDAGVSGTRTPIGQRRRSVRPLREFPGASVWQPSSWGDRVGDGRRRLRRRGDGRGFDHDQAQPSGALL